MLNADATMQDVLKDPQATENAIFMMEKDLLGFHYHTVPVGVEEFILSDRHLNLSESIRPVVMEDMKSLFDSPDDFAYCRYEEAVFNEAIGTGKSFKTSIITSYYYYHLACLVNCQTPFHLEQNSTVTIMNMSINALQAKKVVFTEIKNRILNSRWFMEQGYEPDPKILSELKFKNNVNIIPGHSGELYPLGFSIILAIMDESAFYTDTETHDVAEEMYYALKRRIQSRFSHNGLLIMISSPRYEQDFIERKSKEAEKDSSIFCRRHRIWEVLPEDIKSIEDGDFFTLHEPVPEGGEKAGQDRVDVKIPNKYVKDFEKNPEKAWRDLGATPSLTLEPFFRQKDRIDLCIDPEMKSPINEEGGFYTWFVPRPNTRYYAHVDLGIKHDACGIALAHAENGDTAVVDLIHRIKPKPNFEVDIEEIVNMFLELKLRGFKISKVTYDQFQSAGSIQKLNKCGVSAENLSVDKDLAPYSTLKEQIYIGKVRYYLHEIFLTECKRLELVKGKKVDHPPKGSKDVADAVAGAVFNVTSKELTRKKATMSIV